MTQETLLIIKLRQRVHQLDTAVKNLQKERDTLRTELINKTKKLDELKAKLKAQPTSTTKSTYRRRTTKTQTDEKSEDKETSAEE